MGVSRYARHRVGPRDGGTGEEEEYGERDVNLDVMIRRNPDRSTGRK